MMINKFTLKPIALTLGLTIPAFSFAAGFQINEDSPRLQGQAMAGSASSVNDVTAIFNNPALLGTIQQDQAYFGGSYIDPRVSMNNAAAVHTIVIPGGRVPIIIPNQVTGASSQGNVTKAAFVPNLFAAYRINDKWHAGLAVTAPWGLETSYDADTVVRYMAQDTALQTVNINPELSFSPNSLLSFGIGLQAQQASAHFSQFNSTGVQPTSLSGGAWGYGYDLGVLFSPRDTTHIGLSYRSQINYTLKGNGEQYLIPGSAAGEPFNPLYPFNSNTSVAASLNTPAVLNLSVTQTLNDRWTVSATEQLTYWSSLNQINISMPDAYVKDTVIPLDWKNSWMSSIGAQYALNAKWDLRGGLAYDQTPTQSAYRDARIPDTDRYWATAGASYHINDRFTVDGAYEHIFMNNQNINLTQNNGTPVNGLSPEQNTVQANYSGSTDIVAIGINWLF